MKSLFLDTASSHMIISILDNGKLIDQFIKNNSTDLSSIFVFELEKILKKNNITVQDIDQIYCVVGPGSFTGIRIGVTVAKTIGFCLNKKVIPVSELETLATTNVKTTYIVPVIDARRGYVYAGIYDQKLKPVMKEQRILLDDLLKELSGKDYTFVTNMDIENKINPKQNVEKITNKYSKGINPHILNPNYLKLTEAEENLNDRKNKQ